MREKLLEPVNLLCAVATVAACGLIVAAAGGDLWLDEIWSLDFAERATSPWRLFTDFKHDNNHLLNTLFLYAVRPVKQAFLYRLPAVLCGIGAILMLGRLAGQWGPKARLCVVLLAGSSYPLILYASEARGYAPAWFLALTAFWCRCPTPARSRIPRLVLFWLVSILGLLAYATFVFVLFALLLAACLHREQPCRPLGKKVFRLGAEFGIPLLFCLGYYMFFVRGMVIGGGPDRDAWSVATQAAAICLGLPEVAPLPLLAFLCVAVVTVIGTLLLYRSGFRLWSFFPAAVLVVPLLFVEVAEPTRLYFRYFIICFPFLYLLLGYLLARCLDAKAGLPRWLGVIVIVAFTAGQEVRIGPLLEHGRGEYRAALQYIADHSAGDDLSIGSDHDIRNGLLVDFHLRSVVTDKSLQYVTQEHWRDRRPDWIITHSQDPNFSPPEEMTARDAGSYRLAESFPFGGVSGWSWFLYRRE